MKEYHVYSDQNHTSPNRNDDSDDDDDMSVFSSICPCYKQGVKKICNCYKCKEQAENTISACKKGKLHIHSCSDINMIGHYFLNKTMNIDVKCIKMDKYFKMLHFMKEIK